MAKKVTQKELDRLRRKKGVKIKRKMGAQPATEKPGPDKDREAKSGAKPSKPPVPASPPKAAPAPTINVPPVDMKPYAAMSASIMQSNKNMAALIENNTKVIEEFKVQLAEQVTEVRPRVPWKHKIKRDGLKMIEEIVSIPMERK